MADPYANPYLMPQQQAPDWRQVLANALQGVGAGIGQADAAGRGWGAGIGPGLSMANQMTGQQQQNDWQRQMQGLQYQGVLDQRRAQDEARREKLDMAKAAAARDASMGDQIGTMMGMNVQPNPVRMGPDFSGPASAIAGIESGGRYDALGPETGKGRAYGKYQVMDFNVGPWTQEVLGKPMTPQEFLANPQAQDAVFKAKFGQYSTKHGPEGAARAWFAGEDGMNNPNAADVNGMTVARYGQKFNAGMGGPMVAQAGGPPTQGDAPPQSAIASLPPEVRSGIAIMAQTDPKKAVEMMVQAVQNQEKEGVWVPLDARNKQMFPNLDPTKEYLRNRRTGEIKPIGGSLVTVNTGDKLLPGQKKVDENFADQYVEFVSGGGFADSVKMLNQLQEVQTALKSGASLTGPITGMLGDTLLSFANPNAMAMRDAVFEVAQRNLRLVLGAQFTAKEGENLIARVYNPRLDEKENAKRVERLMSQIKTAMEARIDSSRYFEEHGTLRGWKGRLPSMADFEPAKVPDQPSSPAAAALPAGAAPAPAQPAATIPRAAIKHLMMNPKLVDEFELKYGPGTADAVLRGAK